MSDPAPIIEATDAFLGRLAALDLQAAEHVHGCLMDTTKPGEVAELARAYARASRCVRQTLALHAKLTGDRERSGREAERHAAQTGRATTSAAADPDDDLSRDPDDIYFDARVEDLRDAVDRVITRVVDGDLERHTRLVHRFERELDDWVEAPDFLGSPLDRLVETACRSLGLPEALGRNWQSLAPATFFPEPEELNALDDEDVGAEPPDPGSSRLGRRAGWPNGSTSPMGGGEGERVASIITIEGLSKTYAGGFQALKSVDLTIARGEIFALLGPNGAGKTTLIGIVCGLVRMTAGRVIADGHDIQADYRAARAKIGLVPQEISTDAFETVWDTVKFSRGLFGKPRDDDHLRKVLTDLSLWDKKDAKIQALSGGMKRRVMIAKALSHEPTILFLDEPTAGVDVELRRDMWEMVRGLRDQGVTIILTTHYIEEAEEMADRIGVINRGELILVEEKAALMRKLGKKQLSLHLQEPLAAVPAGLDGYALELADDGRELVYSFDAQAEHTGIAELMKRLAERGIDFKDLKTQESSLEDIFVSLVRGRP